MCLAIYIPANIEVPWDGLENGSEFNSDGMGWAVASKEYGLEVGKSMSYDVAALTLAAAREKHGPDSLVLVHQRFATHGTTDEYNVHPFYVDPDGEERDTVMAHNGVLPKEWHPAPGDRRSDTRVFGDRVARGYTDNGTPSRRGGKALGQMIGSGNKLVFLTAKDGQPKVRIINAHLGIFDGGVWYSNDGYLPSRWGGGLKGWDLPTYKGGTVSVLEDTDGADLPTWRNSTNDCEFCGVVNSVDVASNTCTSCEVCLDCHEWMGDCDCYLPENSGDESQYWTGSPLNPQFVATGIEA